MKQVSRKLQAVTLITLIVVVYVLFQYRPLGYLNVLSAPQYAKLVGFPVVEAKNVVINGEKLQSEKLDWKVRLNDPLPILTGVKQVYIYHEGSPAYLGISLCLKNKHLNNVSLDIINQKIDLGIVTSQQGKRHRSEWSSDASKQACEGILPVSNQPSGEIVMTAYEQSTKHLTMQGSIKNFSTELVGLDGNETHTLSFDTLDFSIDSPVIYEWSNKGGTTWRL